ncbi:MAG: YbaK/EbsC family protein [Terriglobales bacterium]
MPTRKLREFLDGQGIPYAATSHAVAYTAKEIAALTHVSSKELAKTVIVKIDSALAMAVLPASYEVDLSLLRVATGARTVSLAKETEFKDRFPECEIGAMPPFGNLYGMAVYVDESLTKDKDIAFNAGSHNELLQVSYADFERLVRPTVLKFSGLPDVESLGAWHL